MNELFTSIANGDITLAYDKVGEVLDMHGSRLSGEVIAELQRAKDALFRARIATDGEDA